MTVITKTDKHEREAAALAWLSQAFMKGWRVQYIGKHNQGHKEMFELKVAKKTVIYHHATTLIEVIEKAMQDEKTR